MKIPQTCGKLHKPILNKDLKAKTQTKTTSATRLVEAKSAPDGPNLSLFPCTHSSPAKQLLQVKSKHSIIRHGSGHYDYFALIECKHQ